MDSESRLHQKSLIPKLGVQSEQKEVPYLVNVINPGAYNRLTYLIQQNSYVKV